MPFSAAEQRAMEQALQLARGGVRGANPLVGAVILSPSGEVLATGYHRGAGTPHAEAAALTAAATAGTDVRGATMVVTLEPCNHAGRTGPCSQAVLEAGIARVVYAAADSNHDAAGGAAALAAGGVEVEGGLRADESRELNHRWATAAAAHRPFVTVKTAQTLDGRTAAADGSSAWITSGEARADAQALRRRADAVLAGTGTIQADNPRLTARNPDGSDADSQPLRVVMGHSPVPEAARVRGIDGRFLQIPTHDPAVVLADLYDRGVRHLMVEGGGTVAGAFLRAGLADELVAYTAPALLGAGTPAFAGLGIQTMAHIQRWRWDPAGGSSAVPVGPDLRLHLEPLPDFVNEKD
ncbi:bifunctional diaminohydroxyphosphoribosylaminopyrimidine deaminase/5-amino-6-(5-phosphoribosylamino)uracil reductase RibD [Arthrobacter gandavensis]|uniref:bifunctional diaminohydroxyphosphoribosylaminopyrimidine deaminase/5-amino-6-(5-phosphoribosylamino)uracil reductase RibD n=1 Tax=Arthrobacter gandavensis TaxID=169960 RepID=UPI00188E1E3A|nr:bifunctional diaminohydroxyphosphoribosylaminopyrimidine deaminase/5-amino-6-(5-phosphoribosylamino)uracil reductase RibD [Arthrobacter gandavensis]MBF4994987.1 bifunctional diaminohydroxyphosphoribosylaminopyrimidine deaminase/5-amino-6-(5-phosphoribosylamino)uracil reductase RibD [Arthrobacter gandavensis]